jgi:hypothetical protein
MKPRRWLTGSRLFERVSFLHIKGLYSATNAEEVFHFQGQEINEEFWTA